MQVLFSVVLHKFFLLFLRISTPVFIVLHQFGVKIGVNICVGIFPGIIAFQLSSCPFQVNMVVYFNRCFYVGMSHKILIRLNVHSRFGISCTCCVPENMWRNMWQLNLSFIIHGNNPVECLPDIVIRHFIYPQNQSTPVKIKFLFSKFL